MFDEGKIKVVSVPMTSFSCFCNSIDNEGTSSFNTNTKGKDVTCFDYENLLTLHILSIHITLLLNVLCAFCIKKRGKHVPEWKKERRNNGMNASSTVFTVFIQLTAKIIQTMFSQTHRLTSHMLEPPVSIKANARSINC